MSRKILLVLGNCRINGNTEQLADAFIKGAIEAGHEVKKIDLRKLRVCGCVGCNACRFGKPCVQKDDFNSLVPEIKTADMIVFASPLHFWTLSSSIIAFIERFYCIAEEDNDPPYGRYEKYPIHDSALLMTSADENFWTYDKAVDYYNYAIVNYIGFHNKGVLLAGGCGDTNGKPQIQHTDYLNKAYIFGKTVYSDVEVREICHEH